MRRGKSFSAKGVRSLVRALVRRSDGSVAVELGMGVIVFAVLITGLISFGSIFFVGSAMADTARDTARRMALGQLSQSGAPAYAQAHLINWGMTYTVTATITASDAKVTISVPMRQAAMIDYLGLFSGNLESSVTMAVEP